MKIGDSPVENYDSFLLGVKWSKGVLNKMLKAQPTKSSAEFIQTLLMNFSEFYADLLTKVLESKKKDDEKNQSLTNGVTDKQDVCG